MFSGRYLGSDGEHGQRVVFKFQFSGAEEWKDNSAEKRHVEEIFPTCERLWAKDRKGIKAQTVTANVPKNRGISPTHNAQGTLNSSGADRRWLMRTGTLSAKQSTKELKGKNGKSCIVTTEKRVRRQELKNRVKVKKRKPCGQ